MAIRFAAASGLALAAVLLVAPAAQAQNFFSFYEMSPRQVVGMLHDDGYDLRGPMQRRGDVYVCDVVSVSGRTMRLIVDARDGHVVQHFATARRSRSFDDDQGRPSRDVTRYDEQDPAPSERPRHDETALGDLFSPPSRVYGNDSLFSKPEPAPSPDAAQPAKPKRHVVKKQQHHDPSLAKAPAASPSPDAVDAAKPADSTPMAAVAPSAPEAKKPDAAVATPVAPLEAAKPVETVKPVEAAPKPSPTQVKAETEKRAVSEVPAPAPKPESPRKKINDLPVGTLD